MKIIITLGLLIYSFTALAGGYYSPSIDTYDTETGLYYKSVASAGKSGFLSSSEQAITNIYVYNPKSKKGKLLFPNKENFQIIEFIFEDRIDNGVVKFHSDYAAPVKHNIGIKNRNPKSTILILTRDTKTEKETFYFVNKDGSGLTKGRTISPTFDWHIDVKNSEVRLINQAQNTVNIDSFAW